ncbi:MAG: hypothetical protein AAB074_06615 [Planctomycetota bacterium]
MKTLSLLLAALLLAVPALSREVASSKPREGQKPVNDAVNALITKTRDAAIVESWKKSPGDVEKALVAVWKTFTFPLKNKSIASVELLLESDKGIAPELNFGDLTEKERVAHPVYAASFIVRKKGRDLSIGSDKFGHFFEEGFFVRQVAAEDVSRGDALAEGMSKWLEGIEPDAEFVKWIHRNPKLKCWWADEDGRKSYDLVGSFAIHSAGKFTKVEKRSSPADVAANLAGRKWFDELEAILKKAPKDLSGLEKLLRDNPFKVEEVVSEAWDESRNPNVETLDRAPTAK